MKMVELFGVSAVESPRLTGTEEGGKYRCMVDRHLAGKAQFSLSHPSLPVYIQWQDRVKMAGDRLGVSGWLCPPLCHDMPCALHDA